MAKKILFDADARDRVKAGLDRAADAIKITLGPRGRNVILDKGYGGPHMTNDGVTIAKEISFKDRFENMGAEIVKEVASKTNDLAGDGTTTSVVLLQSMVDDGLKRISFGINPMAVRAGIEKGVEDAETELKKLARPVTGPKEIRQVATISAESAEIGETIASVISEVGQNGVVTVEESQTFGIEKEIVEGLEFDRGYVSPYLITNSERMEAEYKDALVLITDKKIASIQEILPVLEAVARTGKKELVIIADDVEGEALATFILNKLRGAFNVLAVKAPGYGDRKKDMLQDIATTVGGTVVSEETGTKLDKVEVGMLGRAQKIIATKDNTIIVGGKGKKSEIEARINSLKKQRDASDSKFDKEKLDERIAKLSGGVAVIRVGAATETEMKYLKDKIEDAVNATKAAIAEGIVPGGGVALLSVGGKLNEKLTNAVIRGDQAFLAGYSTVINACIAPIREIIRNATHDVGIDSVVAVSNVLQRARSKPNLGYDAAKGETVDDMLEAGIIDPAKVSRVALRNAASAAGIFLTTNAAIADEPEEKKEMGGGPQGMGGMDY